MFAKIREVLGLENTEPEKLRIERIRPTWDHTFLLEAYLWSQRSHDPQTQCGCVLTKHHTVLSTGYNGFISGIDDTALPNLRPYKYPFMIHSELNAILNCARHGIHTVGATAYITSEPCNNCLQFMWQAGIVRIVHSDLNTANMVQNEEHQRMHLALRLLMGTRMEVVFIPSKNFLQ